MNQNELEAIEKRLRFVSPHGWILKKPASSAQKYGQHFGENNGTAQIIGSAHGYNDADLIAHAPDDLRALLDEVKRQRVVCGEAAQWVKKRMQPAPNHKPHPMCSCGCWNYSKDVELLNRLTEESHDEND